MLGDFDKHGDIVVPGQALSPAAPDCAEHVGTCVRCHTEIKSKPRKKFQGEQRRQRTRISIAVPKDAQEDGGEVWDNLIQQCQEALGEQSPPYYVLVKVMYDWLTQAPSPE